MSRKMGLFRDIMAVTGVVVVCVCNAVVVMECEGSRGGGEKKGS
jgi:hypothetical protein